MSAENAVQKMGTDSINRALAHHVIRGVVRRWRPEPRGAYTIVLTGRDLTPLKVTTREAKLICEALAVADEVRQQDATRRENDQ